MIAGKRVLGLIPARGGSVGIPRKNLRPLAGKPLVVWTIEAARRSRHLDRVVVSTEDFEIADCARAGGAETPFVRPASLATDTASSIDVALHALGQLPEMEAVALLQPTSPLRSTDDIDRAIELWSERGATVVGVTESPKPPHWMYRIEDGRLVPLLPAAAGSTNRQQLPAAYVLNGAVYVTDRAALVAERAFLTRETIAFLMPPERSVDIDDERDWQYAEYLLRHLRS